jgi:hypothetical protein
MKSRIHKQPHIELMHVKVKKEPNPKVVDVEIKYLCFCGLDR